MADRRDGQGGDNFVACDKNERARPERSISPARSSIDLGNVHDAKVYLLAEQQVVSSP